MKKEYHAPLLYAEDYTLMEHISQSCAWQTNFGNQCPVEEFGTVFFLDSNNACNQDGWDLMEGAGISTSSATIEDLLKLNLKCYNSFSDINSLFTS